MGQIDTSKEQLAQVGLREKISERVNHLLQGKKTIKLLEAGCGSTTHVSFNQEIESVGMDISKEQLARNSLIHKKIHGDIQTYPLQPEEFDVVVCWEVIEHLPKPMMALNNIFHTLKTGGILILVFPNLLSLKGLVTKWTPYWFHKWFYHHMGYQKKPSPTYFRFSIRPRHIKKVAVANGFSIELELLSEGGQQKRIRNRYMFADRFFSLVDSLLKGLTLGKCDSFLLDNCAIILRKTV